MRAEHTAYNILVNLNAESQRDLLRDSRAAPSRITPLHFEDCLNQFFLRSLPARFASLLWREQKAIFSGDQNIMEMKKRRRFYNDCRANNTCGSDQKRTDSSDEPIQCTQIGRSPS